MEAKTQAETQARYAELGRMGGMSISDAKRAAARLNGRKGGRPRKDRRSRILKLWNSSADENWGTPQAFFDALDEEFQFSLDAAASASNHKCERYYTKKENGLIQRWSGRVWCNPPYSATMTPAFMQKAAAERKNCEVIVMLVPSRTSTQWWRDSVWDGEGAKRGVTVRFPPRLKNDTRNHPSRSEKRWPFPCALVIFRPDVAGIKRQNRL
jgi:site-specific DNA-methyltransferase (adenine-specific)